MSSDPGRPAAGNRRDDALPRRAAAASTPPVRALSGAPPLPVSPALYSLARFRVPAYGPALRPAAVVGPDVAPGGPVVHPDDGGFRTPPLEGPRRRLEGAQLRRPGRVTPGDAAVNVIGSMTVSERHSTHLHDFAHHTTALRGFRLGARRAVMLEHHKRCATTSGGLARPPFGSRFPPPRGVGNACRWARIARASPPAEETGNAIV